MHRSSDSVLPIRSKTISPLEIIRSGSSRIGRGLSAWLISLGAVAIVVAVSYQWLDRPIALLAHHEGQLAGHGLLGSLTHIPNPLIPLSLIVLVALGLRALIVRTWSNFQAAAFVCSLSVIVAETAKDQLKFLFGRTWPETWTQNNPSFIRDGVYGFNFMERGGAYQSFPSGHMATACAILAVFWIWYPRLRWLWIIGGIAVGVGLVGANYHFLSDVIAGGFLGISTGWLVASIWNVSVPLKLRSPKKPLQN